jgi:hypothetical protein
MGVMLNQEREPPSLTSEHDRTKGAVKDREEARIIFDVGFRISETSVHIKKTAETVVGSSKFEINSSA